MNPAKVFFSITSCHARFKVPNSGERIWVLSEAETRSILYRTIMARLREVCHHKTSWGQIHF